MRSLRTNHLFFKRYCHAPVQSRDPAPFFFSKPVQKLMLDLNDKTAEIVLRRRKLCQKIETSTYAFFTEEQLAESKRHTHELMMAQLQPPPVLKPRSPIDKLLAKDPNIASTIPHKIVCLDSSASIPHKRRLCAVRETNGDLRLASWEERSRMIQLFMPIPYREVHPPPMFEEQHLKPILDREDYVFVLDRACVQFEPDDPLYISVVSSVYDHVDETRNHERLQNTRHFGSFLFYLAWNRRIDTLLVDMIKREKILSAFNLVELHRLLHDEQPITGSDHSDSQSEDTTRIADQSGDSEQSHSPPITTDPLSDFYQKISSIKGYIEHKSVNKPMLNLALSDYFRVIEEREAIALDIQQAHGHG